MKIVYSRATENLLDSATSVTLHVGTEQTGYELAKLNDGDPARPFKAVEDTVEIRMAWAAPVLPEFPSLINSNLTVAAVFEGSSSAGGAAEVTGTFGVPTLKADGLFTSPFLDLSAEDPKQYWRLLISSNAAAVILGELWLGATYRTINSGYNVEDVEPVSTVRTIRHETDGGATLAYRRVKRREALYGTVGVTTAELADVEAWLQSCDLSARPTLMVPNDEIDEAWMIRLEVDEIRRRPVGPGGWLVELPVRQLSPGVGW